MRNEYPIGAAAVLEGLWALYTPLPFSVPLWWMALATGAVALGYVVRRPDWFAKNPEGQLSWPSLVIFWPWHLHCRTSATIHRWVTGDPPLSPISPGFWLGSWPKETDLPANAAVLDMTAELPRRHQAPYFCAGTWDGQAPSADRLKGAIAFVREQRSQGREIVVHCAHGRGRCATALAAALVDQGVAPDWQAAYVIIRQGRRVRINSEQQRFLAKWSSELTS